MYKSIEAHQKKGTMHRTTALSKTQLTTPCANRPFLPPEPLIQFAKPNRLESPLNPKSTIMNSHKNHSLPRLCQWTAHLGRKLQTLPASRHQPHQHSLVLLLRQDPRAQILVCIRLRRARAHQ
jgi:hypothetical protein